MSNSGRGEAIKAHSSCRCSHWACGSADTAPFSPAVQAARLRPRSATWPLVLCTSRSSYCPPAKGQGICGGGAGLTPNCIPALPGGGACTHGLRRREMEAPGGVLQGRLGSLQPVSTQFLFLSVQGQEGGWGHRVAGCWPWEEWEGPEGQRAGWVCFLSNHSVVAWCRTVQGLSIFWKSFGKCFPLCQWKAALMILFCQRLYLQHGPFETGKERASWT